MPKKQMTIFTFANIKKMFHPNYIILRLQKLGRKQWKKTDEVAHYDSLIFIYDLCKYSYFLFLSLIVLVTVKL